ncbi:MAG: cysteine hydrolase [Gammaproteobacteria bacterium]|nr:cysteine hydrolase [Gammaproteobacteria bacterium]
MALENIDLKKTGLLVMDYQQLLVDGYVANPDAALSRAAEVMQQSRAADIPVFYVTVGFRPGYPEVSDRNMMFSGVRAGERFRLGDGSSAIPDAITPQDGDVVIVKHRVSAFEGTDLAMLLRARDIETLILFGIATSGVVLSTVRQGADLDYRLVVISDLCYDGDAEVHRFLIENILPRQAQVIEASGYLESL